MDIYFEHEGKWMKKNLWIIIGVIAVFVGVIIAKELVLKKEVKESMTGADPYTFKDDLDKAIALGKPVILAFSFEADCCPGTKKFFNDYNLQIKQLFSEYEGRATGFFINTGNLKEETRDLLMEVAKRYQVQQIPSLIILDGAGEKHYQVEGPFQMDAIREKLGQVLQ